MKKILSNAENLSRYKAMVIIPKDKSKLAVILVRKIFEGIQKEDGKIYAYKEPLVVWYELDSYTYDTKRIIYDNADVYNMLCDADLFGYKSLYHANIKIADYNMKYKFKRIDGVYKDILAGKIGV